MRQIFIFCAGLALVGSAPADFNARILAAHNTARADVKASPLAWDVALARDAQRFADQLAQTGRFEHAAQTRHGENLWTGTRSSHSPEEMVGSWVAEKGAFKPGRFPDVSTTGRFEDVGHYTQLIWAGTTHVGCGVGRNAENDVLVCRYAPAGNVAGESPLASTKKLRKPTSKRRRRGG